MHFAEVIIYQRPEFYIPNSVFGKDSFLQKKCGSFFETDSYCKFTICNKSTFGFYNSNYPLLNYKNHLVNHVYTY
ncbi:hypothetical protein M2347_003930 [Chryseobacterium sp. H1D6B]|nr:hypothetical protein [Chryseobacterium sp. H1D6B]